MQYQVSQEHCHSIQNRLQLDQAKQGQRSVAKATVDWSAGGKGLSLSRPDVVTGLDTTSLLC